MVYTCGEMSLETNAKCRNCTDPPTARGLRPVLLREQRGKPRGLSGEAEHSSHHVKEAAEEKKPRPLHEGECVLFCVFFLPLLLPKNQRPLSHELSTQCPANLCVKQLEKRSRVPAGGRFN